jgi:hypothetical protein
MWYLNVTFCSTFAGAAMSLGLGVDRLCALLIPIRFEISKVA